MTQTLVERCDNLLSEIERYHNINQNKTHADDLQRQRKELDNHQTQVSTATHQAQLFIAKTGMDPESLPSPEQAQTSLQAFRDKFTEDSKNITRGRVLRNFKEALENLSDGLEEKNKATWNEYFAGHGVAVDENKLTRFADVADTRNQVLEVRRNIASANKWKTNYPTDENEFSQCQEALNNLVQSYTRLPPDSDDEEVNRFLEAASRNGAEIADLTEKVLSYLKENDLRQSMRITFKR